jgi:ELWxxDGT repeat protein
MKPELGNWSVTMVSDINGHGTYGEISEPVALGDRVLFVASTPDLGSELWTSDGTVLGTVPVKDICPGPGDSSPADLTEFKGRIYFSADDGMAGRELWQTDGTAAGTRRLKDIHPGRDGSAPAHLTAAGDVLFFTATDGAGRALYKTDGTESGTIPVKRLDAGPGYGAKPLFAGVGNTLFFTNYSPAEGYELWKSDGTDAGTVLVKDINPGPQSGVPSDPAVLGNTLFFTAYEPQHGVQVWKTDGTAEGTVMVKETCPKTLPNGNNDGIFDLTPLGSRVIFRVVTHKPVSVQIWSTDGTAERTVRLTQFLRMSGGDRREFIRLGDRVVFQGSTRMLTSSFRTNDPNYDPPSLWATDGTPAGTKKLKAGAGYNQRAALGNEIYFSGTVGDLTAAAATGHELCRTDGTEAGTTLFKDLRPGRESSEPRSLTAAGKLLFFVADDGRGPALWRTDGADAGTLRLAQFPAGTQGSDPAGLTACNTPGGGRVFFTAAGDRHDPYQPTGPQVWASDGTAAGTRRLTEFPADVHFTQWGNARPVAPFTAAARAVFFSVEPEVIHDIAGLWVSDGTPSGTRRIRKDLLAYDRAEVSGKLIFAGVEVEKGKSPAGGVGLQLWQSDGTDRGTTILSKLSDLPGGAAPRAFAMAGGRLFFCARHDDPHVRWLYATDGTPGGAVQLKKMDVSASAALGKDLIAAALGEDRKTLELWKSDGTPDGTVKIRAFPARSFVRDMAAAGGRVYFSAFTPEFGLELWKTDGTAAGTSLVKDIVPGVEGSYVGHLTAYEDRLYFTAMLPGQLPGLWTTDGTAIRTKSSVRFWPRGVNPGVCSLTKAAGLLFLSAGGNDCEPWASNGSKTRRLADLRPGPAGSEPRDYCEMGGAVYFSANDGVHGRELWKAERIP